MSYYKEIVTKAVVGKGKKATDEKYTITPENKPDTVLGCWITNHKFNGTTNGNDIFINGTFDINIWYSYENNTKTGVVSGSFNYNDKMNVNSAKTNKVSNNTEVIVNALSDPNVTDVSLDNGNINFNVHKEMGIELVGDAKIKINAIDDFDDYADIIDSNDDILNEIDDSVNENYLNEEKTSDKED